MLTGACFALLSLAFRVDTGREVGVPGTAVFVNGPAVLPNPPLSDGDLDELLGGEVA